MRIIEAKTPYYIKLWDPVFQDIINYVNTLNMPIIGDFDVSDAKFQIAKSDNTVFNQILSLMQPVTNVLQLNSDNTVISKLITPAGGYKLPHSDGHYVALNIPLIVDDDCCTTSWWDYNDLSDCKVIRPVESYNLRSVNSDTFNNMPRIPVVSTVLQPGQAMLLNSKAWHSWDNKNSSNSRQVLTIRRKDGAVFDELVNLLLSGADVCL